jgi:hypothetical protein
MNAADAMTMLFLVCSIVVFISLVTIWAMTTARTRPAEKVCEEDDSQDMRIESEDETRGVSSGVEGLRFYSDRV